MWLWINNLNLAALPARATILANLFLHYAFDMWMARSFPHIPFERYADDVICHCKSADEAQALWSVLADRFAACELVLHPQRLTEKAKKARKGQKKRVIPVRL